MEKMDSWPKSLGLIAYFLVSGIFFLFFPWTSLWPRAIYLPPVLAMFFANAVTKGLVSGFGLVLLLGALFEVHNAFSRKQ